MECKNIDDILKFAKPKSLYSWIMEENLDGSIFFQKFYEESESSISEIIPDNALKYMETSDSDLVGSTPLHYAIEENSKLPFLLDEMLLILRKESEDYEMSDTIPKNSETLKSFNWNVQNSRGYSCIALAARKNDFRSVEKIIKAGSDVSNIYSVMTGENEERFTSNLLGLSVYFNSFETLKTLIANGADSSQWDSTGKRPIHVAVIYGRFDALQVLLEDDGLIDSDSKENITNAYLVREEFGHFEINDSDEDGIGREESALISTNQDSAMQVTSSISEGEVRERTQWDEDSNSSFDGGENALFGSEEGEQLSPEEIMELEREMEEAGFEIRRDGSGNITAHFTGRKNPQNIDANRDDIDSGSNLLHLACKYSQTEIASFLLSVGRNLQHVDDLRYDGMSAMHIASKVDNIDLLCLLSESGAQANLRNDSLGMCPIHISCENASLESLKFFLSTGVCVNECDDNGFTPLHYASTNGEAHKCVKLLIENGADVNKKANDGETPLYTAISRWNLNIFWELMNNGADPGATHSDGTVVIGFIAANSMDELAKFSEFIAENNYRQAPVDVDVIIGDHEQTALHIASREGSGRAIQALIRAGACANKTDENGLTPLMILMQNKKLNPSLAMKGIRALLDNGANPNISDGNGSFPLHYACRNGYSEIARILLEKGANVDARTNSKTALYLSVQSMQIDSIRVLLSFKASMDLEDEDSLTPLHLCSKLHYLEGLKCLVMAGADPNKTTAEGDTCLHLSAYSRGYKVSQVIEALQSYGALLNLPNEKGDQPIHTHIAKKRMDGVRALIHCGCDIDAISKSNQSPLMAACDNGHIESVIMLLRRGADVNWENESKHTALFYFADSETTSIRILRLLIRAGANIYHRDKDGDTVLHEAVLGNNATITRFLLTRGTEINSRNNALETPLFQAAKNGFSETVKVLLEGFPSLGAADPKIPNRAGVSPYQAARSAGHHEVLHRILRAMKITLSTIAPESRYSSSSPTSHEIFEAPVETMNAEDSICIICQEVFHEGEKFRKLPCGHEFHNSCILPWIGGEEMTSNQTCPTCKQQIEPFGI